MKLKAHRRYVTFIPCALRGMRKMSPSGGIWGALERRGSPGEAQSHGQDKRICKEKDRHPVLAGLCAQKQGWRLRHRKGSPAADMGVAVRHVCLPDVERLQMLLETVVSSNVPRGGLSLPLTRWRVFLSRSRIPHRALSTAKGKKSENCFWTPYIISECFKV